MLYTASSFKWHLFYTRASGLELCNVKASYPCMVFGFNCSPDYSGIFSFQTLLLSPTVVLLTNSLLCEWQPTAASGMNLRPFQPVLLSQGRPKSLLVALAELSCCKPLWSSTCWGTTTLCLGRMGLRRPWALGLGLPQQRHPSLCVDLSVLNPLSATSFTTAVGGCTTAVHHKLSFPG